MSTEQIEADLQKHLTGKVEAAIKDCCELLDTNAECSRAATMAVIAALSYAAAFAHEARKELPGPVPSQRDFYFSILKWIADHVPTALGNERRG